MNISYEEMLFRYGLSCVHNLLLLKKITKDEYDEIYLYADRKEIPSREFLERIFSEAIRRIGPDKTAKAVDDYFRFRHNQIIDNRDGNYKLLSDEQCEDCKTYEGEIIKVEYKMDVPIYTVRVIAKNELTIGKYLWDDVKIGDKIVAHNHSGVRKL